MNEGPEMSQVPDPSPKSSGNRKPRASCPRLRRARLARRTPSLPFLPLVLRAGIGLLLLTTLAAAPAHAQAGICGRTAVVRNAILARISGVSDCTQVTDAHLAAIAGELYLNGKGITALAAGISTG